MIPEVMTSPAQVAVALDPAAVEFNQTLADMEAYNKKKAADTAKLAELTRQTEEKAKPKPQPIKLEYKYSGTCPDCTVPIKTLIANIGLKLIAFAFCDKCTTQFNTIEVQPINNPIPAPVKLPEVAKTAEEPKGDIMVKRSRNK